MKIKKKKFFSRIFRFSILRCRQNTYVNTEIFHSSILHRPCLILNAEKLQMNSIKHHRGGHLRRILIFQSIKATAQPFTLALGKLLTCSVCTQQRTRKQLVFQNIFQYSHTTALESTFFVSNWWFFRVTEILTCTQWRSWKSV